MMLSVLNVANMFYVLGLSLLTNYALVHLLRILFQFVERLCFGSFASVFALTLFISYALFDFLWFVCSFVYF